MEEKFNISYIWGSELLDTYNFKI